MTFVHVSYTYIQLQIKTEIETYLLILENKNGTVVC